LCRYNHPSKEDGDDAEAERAAALLAMQAGARRSCVRLRRSEPLKPGDA
jgi:hypothetical protein